MQNTRNFGPRFRAYRKAAGKTIPQVAKALKKSTGYISQMERGEAIPLAWHECTLAEKFLGTCQDTGLWVKGATEREEWNRADVVAGRLKQVYRKMPKHVQTAVRVLVEGKYDE